MTESLLKIPKRYCYKITQGVSMKSLVALWVFLLFLSVSYGEEYKCVNEMKITYWSTGCDFFESKKSMMILIFTVDQMTLKYCLKITMKIL